MGKYIKIFNTYEEYSSYAKDPHKYVRPNLSYCINNDIVCYDAAKQYLKFTSVGGNYVGFNGCTGLSYSLDDGITWSEPSTSSSVTVILSEGESVMFKGTLSPIENSNIGHFSVSGHFNLSGNIMSLLYGDDFENKFSLEGKNFIFSSLFSGVSGLKDISGLLLPATTLSNNCYATMFAGCYNITTAPSLPATTLTNNCYSTMFASCTSLTTAPSLPATTLASNCYSSMFSNCTSLTTAPELPATTLASNCYSSMFSGCSNLNRAPSLSATTLGEGSCSYMFSKCTNLTAAPELHVTSVGSSACTGMFSGCTNLATAMSILPAATLSTHCYSSMFSSCSNLNRAPQLPALTLADHCYSNMFYHCQKLNYIDASFTTTPSSSYTQNWVYGVANKGVFVKNDNAQWDVTGSNGVPVGWDTMMESEKPIKWAESSYEFPINSRKRPILLNIDNVPVTYASSDNSVATIDAEGVVAFVGEGNCTLTASFSGDSKYSAKTATCLLTVSEYSYEADYMTIVSTEDNNDIKWNSKNGSVTRWIYASTDNGETWTTHTATTGGTKIATLNRGDKLLIKGNNPYYYYNSDWNNFSSTGNFTLEGNSMSLIKGDDFDGWKTLSNNYALAFIFRGCSGLTNAENFQLPATELTSACYEQMFYGCTGLIAAPELPATTLANKCYYAMFDNCASLTTAPELPATTLAYECYMSMFDSCTSLTTAPELPATTLDGGCYAYMFSDCTSLTTAPELSAETINERGYYYMFNGCSSLSGITCLATDISANRAVECWVENVASNGVFTKNSNMNDWGRGINGIPTNWTVRDAS